MLSRRIAKTVYGAADHDEASAWVDLSEASLLGHVQILRFPRTDLIRGVDAFAANNLYGCSVAQHDKNVVSLQQAMTYQEQGHRIAEFYTFLYYKKAAMPQ